MRISMIGTRGVPARYGGFETAIEEIGQRLAARGHTVVVYTRPTRGEPAVREYRGMHLVPLPAVHTKSLQTLTHSALSGVHSLVRRPADVALLFNAANAMYLPLIQAGGVPTATHVDGLEWRRSKWGRVGKRFYRISEQLAVRYSDALIADAAGIARYYREEFGAVCDTIGYGAPILTHSGHDLLPRGLRPHGFHLVVARFEPENHVQQIVEGYVTGDVSLPLVVVGGTPFGGEYSQQVEAVARRDPRVRLLGPVWDQHVLDQLYANSATYVHGHSVGGTNPSLLRAMGAGTAVVAWDVIFNREVAGPNAWYCSSSAELAACLAAAEADLALLERRGEQMRDRARRKYNWEDVTTAYEELCERLAGGYSQRKQVTGRRARPSRWSETL